MALQFVLGSSGSGKTEYIYERLVRQAGEHPKKNYLVIVPEQFTMQTQQKLVELAPNHAIMNIDVLSFKRLAYRVFDDMGMQDIQVLEETGKNLPEKTSGKFPEPEKTGRNQDIDIDIEKDIEKEKYEGAVRAISSFRDSDELAEWKANGG